MLWFILLNFQKLVILCRYLEAHYFPVFVHKLISVRLSRAAVNILSVVPRHQKKIDNHAITNAKLIIFIVKSKILTRIIKLQIAFSNSLHSCRSNE